MKKPALIFLFVFYAVFVFSARADHSLCAREEGIDSIEVIISVPENNNACYQQIRATLSEMSGAKLLAFCGNHSVFMLYVDKNIYASGTIFFDELKSKAPQYAELIDIKGGTIAGLICDVTNETDAETIKQLKK
jgi:hypothetical protein